MPSEVLTLQEPDGWKLEVQRIEGVEAVVAVVAVVIGDHHHEVALNADQVRALVGFLQ